ncbi:MULTISPECIES: hypothetical protein [Staphylococcus]|uniref:hypothetical protein n=1 Tax=Staphylococcus TaxID=1279 RepID=UPI000763CC08|nr:MULTISPECIES: hypothetical protein [Staphylococcus]KXA47481.1 hypothetical protein HMPREF3215_00128 [Staphylococcus simulans]OFJ77437.1 hypothetical protein HMPREF2846_09925 [Staphylococcus sp. HMSC056G08]OFM14445.1 hypothetical protein HMPREF2713_10185 [Staphylococcus sp. HMSC059E03]OFN19698.1 hypothetical protein HMPREF2603_08860 [Staphylococcus sp. HMSC055C03]OHR53286.1 hypothetical protein HMPREF2798_08150 [Staphylococcus sp. HMSC070A03]
MEQITLTKQELIEIVEREVSKRLDGKKTIKPISIFNEVRITEDDIANINEDFNFTKFIKPPYRGRHYRPLALKKYLCDSNNYFHKYFNGKVNDDNIHELIRKLTLAVFGVSRNSDLSEREFEEAAKIYRYFKDMYLHLYKKRLSNLSNEDFE